ncbi:protease HtpX [candidate division KSB3 bacterium]|uniref:Protease HtpX homolog n=1 Tax=candidate division KSB3 bacterium TaxID=2044937 RepID=A0A2G6E6M7_9BACT|nr:MAG: protease HtpX [candidate division KSB3 bacterium]PIE29959.1 MAG: protease HtpX [candidate division KSB3 bacterium]
MNSVKTAVLMAGLAGLLMAVGGVVAGDSGIVTAFIIALGMNFFSYWYSDKIVLKMYRAKEVSASSAPDLYRLVERLTKQANLPMPNVYIIPTENPNAFATGRNPKHAAVAVTSGIMRLLTQEELAGVISHELGHVKHRDILVSTIAATFATAVSFLASMARWAAIFGGGRDDDDDGGGIIGLLAATILAPIAAAIIQMAISRSREFMADKAGAEISGAPLALANALSKISRGVEARPLAATPSHNATAHMFIMKPFSGSKGLMSLFSTHPSTEERISRLRAMAH